MKGHVAVWMALWWQSALVVRLGAPAEPEHLFFERNITVSAAIPNTANPKSAMPEIAIPGLACVTLDAETLAHTASPAHTDLRVFAVPVPGTTATGTAVAGTAVAGGTEVPYFLTESGPEPVGDAQAVVENLTRRGDTLHFNLRMPARPYSEVRLLLRGHDFVGSVRVSGVERGKTVSLGSFAIFDLQRSGLGQWTVLPLAETETPVLHVDLNLRTPGGVPVRDPPLALVAGAAVPPSRERQTLFTAVASIHAVRQEGSTSVAVLRVPAHVPIEQVRFEMTPGYSGNFARRVTLRARPAGDPFAETEILEAGVLQTVHLPSGDPGVNSIHVEENRLEATLGATLAGPAEVRVEVQNDGLPPLPIREVSLAMRERRLCFAAIPTARYTLRYGDPALQAPFYVDLPAVTETQPPMTATLGPQRRNPVWVARGDHRPFFDRHPEVFWVLVLLCGGMMGGTALQFVQQREGGFRA